jgi:hypothetical protein
VTGRVLVTARCRRKGHVLAEFTATAVGRAVHIRQPLTSYRDGDGQVVRADHDGGPLADASGEPFRLDRGMLSGGESYRAGCPCGRPCLVRRGDLEAAEAAGKTAIFLHPMR